MSNTKKLLDEYFNTRPESTAFKIRGQIDKPELYQYEEQIGKSLVEFDAMEIAEMLKTFSAKTSPGKTYRITYRTYAVLLSLLRDFFNWYIDTYEVIKNPCNDKRIKGKSAIDLFDEGTEAFSKDTMEDVIETIRNNLVEEYADYQEAIVRMFYEGFPEAIDIVNLKAEDIDHENKTAIVRGRKIQLSDRLYELLVKLNKMEELPAHRGSYLFKSYRGSFFKFPTREKFENEFDEREPEYWAGHISRVFNRDLHVKLGLNINARMLYLLGFYDYICGKIGKEETAKMLRSIREPKESQRLMDFANEYNVQEKNVTILKKLLLQFVE